MIAWLGPVAGAALIPPKVVTVEVVTVDPVPPPPPPKPVARAIAAVKHALVTNRSPKVQPTPVPPEPPPPAPAPAAQPETPVAPAPVVEAPTTPNPQPAAAGTETFAGGDVTLGRGGSSGARAGQNLAAVGPSTSSLGADGTGTLTSFAVPKGGYQMKPSYPESARRAGIEGTSLLRFEITEGGMAWRNRVLYPFSTRLDREGIYLGAAFAFAEMLLHGATTCRRTSPAGRSPRPLPGGWPRH